jgi:hypothetical protein
MHNQRKIFRKTLVFCIIICFLLSSTIAFAITNIKINHPPDRPDKPSGPIKCKPGETYTYTAVTNDSDNDKIAYLFDWGDGTTSGWTDFFPSGTKASAIHGWNNGFLYIRVKAKDTFGAESDWSEPLVPSKINSFNKEILKDKFPDNDQINPLKKSNGLFDGRIWYVYSDYAWGEWDTGFYALGPGNITRHQAWDEEFLNTGTWTDDGRFLCLSYDSGVLYEINPKTFEVNFIGGGGKTLMGLSYDPVTKELFASGDDKCLYKINLETGEPEKIGPFEGGAGYMVGMAFDINGTLYGWDFVMDSLWTIDTETGEATQVGSLGISLNFATDGDLDKILDCIFLVSYTTGGQIYMCDKTTGQCTLVGSIEENFEISALAISYELNMVPPSTTIILDPIISDLPEGLFKTGYLISFNAKDNTGVIDTFYRINGGNWKTYVSPFVLSEEDFIIEYFSYDYVGNVEEVKVFDSSDVQRPPNDPEIIGPTQGKPGVEYNYTFVAIDPNEDYINYSIDWGDGIWFNYGLFLSGEELNLSNIWEEEGAYVIQCMASDIHGENSNITTLEVNVPRTKMAIHHLIFKG